ncbi:MAG: addiction module protein [Chthoniobacteraceae bacterium]
MPLLARETIDLAREILHLASGASGLAREMGDTRAQSFFPHAPDAVFDFYGSAYPDAGGEGFDRNSSSFGGLDPSCNSRECSAMAKALDAVIKEAMNLSLEEKLYLANCLLESAEDTASEGAEQEWDREIADRITAIDEGRESGVAYEDVRRAVRARLNL